MTDPAPNSTQPLVEPLTRREQEILALLAQGLSGPEIAQKLTLARNSVRWYFQQLYAKLGVNSKQQAILRAQELGLLAPPSAPAEPKPAAVPPPAPPHNLPQQLNNFVGRVQQIADVKRLLTSTRLLTLIGPGGTGKTRLALQVAAEMMAAYPDGAWLVELAANTQPAQVPQTVAQALASRAATAEPFELAPDSSGADRDALTLPANTCAPDRCCSSWITASTWWRPARSWPSSCCGPRRVCASWRPAARPCA